MARERSPRSRSALLTALDQVMRKATAQSALIGRRTAQKAGLNATDLECLELLCREPSATAGRLAELTGLTTGAITAVIDRLERAGFVRRVPNNHDRRSVIVEALATGPRLLQQLVEPLTRSMDKLNERYDDAELALVLDYLTLVLEAGADHMKWLEDTSLPAVRTHRKPRR